MHMTDIVWLFNRARRAERERERGIDTIFHHKNVAVLIFYKARLSGRYFVR
jgi:hypothetical protein